MMDEEKLREIHEKVLEYAGNLMQDAASDGIVFDSLTYPNGPYGDEPGYLHGYHVREHRQIGTPDNQITMVDVYAIEVTISKL